MGEKVVVIGGTAAGLSAASKAKRVRPDLEIEVYERTGFISYGACGLPYFVGGMIEDPNELVSLFPEEMSQKRGIPTYTRHEVTAIDRENKVVSVTDLESGRQFQRPYDKLVIATGASPIRLPLPGMDLEGVYYLRTVEDGIYLKDAITQKKHIAILGGGFIGLEMAEELTQAGVEVHVFEQLPRLLPFLEESFSAVVAQTLAENGVHLHIGTEVSRILGSDGVVTGIETAQREQIPVDGVLASVGVRPASQLAAACGLKLGFKGGIVVDEHQRTSDPSIWACGDCVEMKHLITGEAVYVPLGTTANKQGRVAGGSLAGEEASFPGVLGSMVTKVFQLYIAATGLSQEQARAAGYQVASTIIRKRDRASYYPGGTDTQICLVVDQSSGRLLGAQVIGGSTVAGRVNVFATAITAGMTVAQINELDLVYAPPVAPVYDPILIAASQAIKLVHP
ncbi:FAD-dependent oxidoreductase [Flavonifractor sp. An100]|uniref:FAD-dependent oxidoreductase n=1 Tax=Flavonifractor sp. An100 TaxID=1965538 RepID=UPI000B3A7B26|nr:FAD-dependent oxidoreductase [Flavonifractor sp. An100]OUQ78470.1 CoA-disulfide reductase [Flavonifractor sp. An100]